VDRVHEALLDPERVVQDLGEGGQAVGRAAGVADDVVLGRIVLVGVDAEDDGDVLILRRGADQDLLGTGGDVGLGLLGVGEDAGGLDDDVDAEVLPGQGGRILDLKNLTFLPLMTMASSVWVTVPWKLPYVESWAKRRAFVGTSTRSLTATTSSSGARSRIAFRD
jgi:hypothetical protein